MRNIIFRDKKSFISGIQTEIRTTNKINIRIVRERSEEKKRGDELVRDENQCEIVLFSFTVNVHSHVSISLNLVYTTENDIRITNFIIISRIRSIHGVYGYRQSHIYTYCAHINNFTYSYRCCALRFAKAEHRM